MTVDFRSDWSSTTGAVKGAHHPFPARQVNFVIAATQGAYSSRHIDAVGFGTVVEMLWGSKIWWILTPDLKRYPGRFADKLTNPLNIPFKYWKISAIRLTAGDVM